jgi:hypothetical protein
VFNRFRMKCFLHEALMFWGYAASRCIIDNTNLARLRGSGKRAVIVPEMVSFAERYGFRIRLSRDRPRKSEGRRGAKFLDGGDQLPAGPDLREPGGPEPAGARVGHVRMHHRPVSKTGLIPANAFEHERAYSDRTDAASSPTLPGPRARDGPVRIRVLRGKLLLGPGNRSRRSQGSAIRGALEDLPASLLRGRVSAAGGRRQGPFAPEGQPLPRHAPKKRPRESREEESGSGHGRGRRGLPRLCPPSSRHPAASLCAAAVRIERPGEPAVFVQALGRALRYRILQIDTLTASPGSV